MSARDAVAEALAVLTVRAPRSFTWLGERFEITADRRDDDAVALTEALREHLYIDFYCAGGVAPTTVPHLMPPREQPPAPLRGVSTQDGWTVAGIDGEDVVIRAAGLTLWSEAWRVGPHDAVTAVGDAVTVEIPATNAGPPGGFRSSVGVAGPGMRFGPGVVLDRFYWNVRPEAADRLVTSVADALDERLVPFRIKTANDTRTPRCDAAVLYTPRDARATVGDVVARVAPAVAPLLRDGTPVFTRRLAPGVAFAEDPGPDESFGTHRCRLLADAVVAAARAGVDDPEGRMAVVAEAFAAAGVPLERVHLSPGSDVLDDPVIVAA